MSARKEQGRKRADRRELSERENAFVRHFTAGVDGVRGRGMPSAIAAGYSRNYARVWCCCWITDNREDSRNKRVWDAVHKIRAKQQAAAERKLRDWMELAVDAQAQIAAVQMGSVLYGREEGEPVRRLIADTKQAKIADTMIRAASEALDRALGKARQSHEVTGKDGGPIEVNWRHELERRLASIAGRDNAAAVPGEPESE